MCWKYSLDDRCGAIQSGALGSSNEALDGILGFGQANSSALSQLAVAGTVGQARTITMTFITEVYHVNHLFDEKIFVCYTHTLWYLELRHMMQVISFVDMNTFVCHIFALYFIIYGIIA